MRLWWILAGVVLAGACRGTLVEDPIGGKDPIVDGDTDTTEDPESQDADLDGYTIDDDCDDTNILINPGEVEVAYDGADNDCDPSTLDDDLDSDGFVLSGDCNDTDPGINPGVAELCDGVDNDCSGVIDDALGGMWYLDLDGDGFGDAETGVSTCDPGSERVQDATDCDDSLDGVYPGALELCNDLDDDCDGSVDVNAADALPWYADLDGDSYGDVIAVTLSCDAPVGSVADGTDCDDAVAEIRPFAPELCNGLDDDCDSLIDDGATDPGVYFADADGDGWGDAAAPQLACGQPAGTASQAGDCDDAQAASFPGNPELCDGLDNNCDTRVDEDGAAGATWFRDLDADGYGDLASTLLACTQPTGYVGDSTDCLDAVPTVFPGALELCDGLDNDCDAQIDEGATQLATWYADSDADGFGSASSTTEACAQPAGYVAAPNDCDDAAAAVFPGAVELCNGVDDDCDVLVDEATAADAPLWYLDADSDSFGGAAITLRACAQPLGFTDDSADCDDLRAEIFPGAEEICDGRDNDCDTQIDDNVVSPSSFWFDADGDGFGDAANLLQACTAPAGWVENDADCDDGRPSVRPGGVELCNDLDDDCDLQIDDGAIDPRTWYADGDGDGFGAGATFSACSQPAGYVADRTDCDDVRVDVNPTADERCDTVDNDCDSRVDEAGAVDAPTWYADADLDTWGNPNVPLAACAQPAGYVERDGDCADSLASVNPDGSEVCNGLDDDCNGLLDDAAAGGTWHADGDGDGYGSAEVILSCTQPPGTVLDGSDCDDADPTVSPARTEVCDGVDNDCTGAIDDDAIDAVYWAIDADGDQYGWPGTLLLACVRPVGYTGNRTDCDDANNLINPRADELCDGIDNDCDGIADVGAVDVVVFFADADGDGAGDANAPAIACDAPFGYVAAGGDCDDAEPASFPGNTELCDGLDNDCEGGVDEAGAAGGVTYYRDLDGDGFGNDLRPLEACRLPVGYAEIGTDCDDVVSSVYPAAPELCDGLDNDCDTQIDEGATALGTWYQDRDGDGYGVETVTQQSCARPDGYVAAAGDCDDDNEAAAPDNTEYCDAYDNDCDGTVDEASAADAPVWYLDADADAYGTTAVSQRACVAPAGFVEDATDCGDLDPDTYPGALELCDGLDNDCDLLVDDGAGSTPFYPDLDGDGYGAGASVAACVPPPGYVANTSDCDDNASAVRPGGIEVCNSRDDDCDAEIDEGAINPRDWYLDADADGWGDAAQTTAACAVPAGYTGRPGDCDDGRNTDRPGANELCDGRDNDCDLQTDEGAVDATTWYADRDRDTYGNVNVPLAACTQPAGYVADAADCADNQAAVFPGAVELCDGVDNDCSGVADDGVLGSVVFYVDADGDGFGNPSDTREACSQPAGTVSNDDDCNDADVTVSPARTEVCNAVDDDCDGTADDAAVDAATWYTDGDGDGFGRAGATVRACSQPAGTSALPTDCDDTAAAVRPGAAEVCDGIDNDCAGGADVGAADATTWYRDGDADTYGNANASVQTCTQPAGYVADDNDCADNRPLIHPGQPEVCDGLDNDCSGAADDGALASVTWYQDGDRDGFGDAATSQPSCSQPAGFVRDATDCDDTRSSVRPNASEICDGLDNDCDGAADDAVAGASSWWADSDEDGYGDSAVRVAACAAPPGYVDNDEDCDDTSDLANPDGFEVCDDLDNDCDGGVDVGAADATTSWRDGDRDGFGDAAAPLATCGTPTGYVSNDDDCQDGLATAFPGATERCDGYDNDCNGAVDDGAVSTATWYQDADADGFGNAASAVSTCSPPPGYVIDGRDCNDGNFAVRPGATERCNGVDDDCDGTPDDGALDALTWYADGDNDGYGAGLTTTACAQPAGYAGVGGDCNDASAAVSPVGTEVCNSTDDDCDGTPDDNVAGAPTWYRDADRDTFGNVDFARVQCTQPSGFVANGSDCLDSVNTVYPGASELCDGLDNDCDAVVDDNASGSRTWYRDVDGDGFGTSTSRTTACNQPAGYVLDGRDCRDDLVAVNPAATERCDSIDNNCDAVVDTDAIDRVTWYVDADRDTYGAATGGQACAVPANGSLVRGDCDDTFAGSYPGASEVCDTRDNNCDGTVDGPNPVGAPTWYLDFDRDGRAGSAVTVNACAAPANHYATATDCDDGAPTTYPAAPELCDGRDNDCDTQVDEGVVNPITFYIDSDGDGFGGSAGAYTGCVNPGGYVSTGGDCNDANTAVKPGATEYCDTIDNNCNGLTDEAAAADAITWYQDSDGDLYGNNARPRVSCEQPRGYVGDNTDCNDLLAVDFPGATERCDTRDNDCDRVTDEADAADAPTWYLDLDNDSYGVSTSTLRQCTRPSGYAGIAGDCDNGRPTVNPSAPEICDTLDNNCNGVTDGAEAIDAATWYRDADSDTFGNELATTLSCVRPAGYVSNDDDCNDVRGDVRPTALEVCNGVDDDCTSEIDDNTAVCPFPVYREDGHAYFFATSPLPWTQARDYCAARGYYLLVINDIIENFWTDGISDYYSEAKWWTGMNDLTTEGQWGWVNGDAVTYTNWHAGEPNNVFSGTFNQDEDCMQYNRYGDGTWNDEWCSQAFMFICEAGN